MSKHSVIVDEILGFAEAKNVIEKVTASEENAADPSFIKHRVFLNQVDTYHAKYIASVCCMPKILNANLNIFNASSI